MLKSKRLFLIVTTIRNKKFSFHAIALRYKTCEKFVHNKDKKKRIIKDFSKNRQLFFDQKETIIFRFVNEFIALKFSFGKYLIKEKALLLF